MTKAEIHQAHLDILLVSENNVLTEAEKQTELTLSAMQEQSVAFGNYFRDNVVLDGAPKMYHKPTKTRVSMEQLYETFNKL